ncbi:hypothetical protein ABDK00_012715 [Niabella insulamsoli]|uniref:hypothetical protein n=1 Tax=Niabella insulamsoli TaxID=3144874 RepID=UPI0031FCA0AC
MSETNTPLQKDIEDLVNKTIEANKIFFNESARLLKQMASDPGSTKTIPVFNNDFLSKAMNAYASLSVRHLKNMIDLGLSLTRQASSSTEPDQPEDTAPAFILKGACVAGAAVQLQFVIDNDKKEMATCELVHTDFLLQPGASVKGAFTTVFTPRSFELQPGGSQAIVIDIQTAKRSVPGLYSSRVQVKGFEPAFFSIELTIN